MGVLNKYIPKPLTYIQGGFNTKKILFRKKELENPSKDIKDRNQAQKVRINWKLLREMRKWPRDKKDEFFEGRAQLARSQWTDRWVKYFPNPEAPDGIDHNNPYMQVEWAMCDFRFLWKVCHKNQKVVEKALSQLSPEAREVYLTGKGPGNSKTYYEVSINGSMWQQMKNAIGIKSKPSEDELEQTLAEMYQDEESENGDSTEVQK